MTLPTSSPSDHAVFVAEVVDACRRAGLDPRSSAAAVGWALVRAGHVTRLPPVPLFEDAPDDVRRLAATLSEPPSGVEPAWLLGQVYESGLSADTRRRTGAFFTPPTTARGFVSLAIAGWERPLTELRVCDPAIGGGAFALAVAEALEAAGLDRRTIVAHHLWGIDIDPDAIEVARAALSIWAGVDAHDQLVEPGTHLLVGDGLVADPSAGGEPFDLVIGNPPFKGQLGSATARTKAERDALAERFGASSKGYTDSAALFLLAGRDLVGIGGRVAMIQPASTLVAAHARPVRSALLDDGDLVGLWLGGRKVFSATAAVSVCGVVIERSDDRTAERTTSVRRASGPRVDPAASIAVERQAVAGSDTWADLVADLRGLPAHEIETAGELGEWATATAGFRDQFYGLVPHVRDPATSDLPRLMTTGLIDPLVSHWGRSPTRLAGRRLDAPGIDLTSLEAGDPTLAGWVGDRLHPKVLVATQSRVIEVVVDPDGSMVPSVPVIAVAADPERLWHVAAVLTAPPVSLWALRHHGGAALSEDTIKLSARQVLTIPLPADAGPIGEAATAARVATEAAAGDRVSADQWDEAMWTLGMAMCRAYRVDQPSVLTQWWFDRLPRRFR